MNIPQTFKQYGQVPFYYTNGFLLSNDATTPNSILDIGTGTMLDSTQTFQIDLLTATTVSNAFVGAGGLDTGTVAASKVYAVYIVADATGANLPVGMISLSLSGPIMPTGYSIYGLIGYVTTDASSHFLKGYWKDANSSLRLFMYDAPIATAVTAGHATTYTNVDLTKFVPLRNNVVVLVNTAYTPATAGNTLKMQPGNATGDAITVTGQVATVAVTTQYPVLAQTVTISTVPSPVINYKETNASDAVAINVAGYYFEV